MLTAARSNFWGQMRKATKNESDFWAAASWTVPFSLALGISLVACIAAAIASPDYYASASLRQIGPAVASVMAVIAVFFWRTASMAKRGVAVGLHTAAVLLAVGTVAFALQY